MIAMKILTYVAIALVCIFIYAVLSLLADWLIAVIRSNRKTCSRCALRFACHPKLVEQGIPIPVCCEDFIWRARRVAPSRDVTQNEEPGELAGDTDCVTKSKRED